MQLLMTRFYNERVKAWPSSLLGVAGVLYGILLTYLPKECQGALDNWQAWVPGAALVVWGLVTKGAPKDADLVPKAKPSVTPAPDPPGAGLRSWLIGFLILSVTLVGCGPVVVSMPLGTAAVMYSNAKADYAVGKYIVTQLCRAGKIPVATCDDAKQIDIRAKVYSETIEKALMSPEQTVDWEKVMKYSEEVVGLLFKLGVAP